MIEINHLVKKYGDHVAVNDLSLKIESGQIYGFLGPNGAGKSTTMNILTGYLGATSGEIKINGFDILAQPEEAKKCIGYLPEIPPLYIDMTVVEYMNFVAELKKVEKNKRKMYVQEAMELTKILGVKNRLIRNLSKGYRQRVGLAQAVLGYPEVLILDEPTVGLDPKQIIEIRELIKTLGQKHTVILSSHILTEISEVCDHIFIISNGTLVASDTTENLTIASQGYQEIQTILKASTRETEELMNSLKGIDSFEINRGIETGTVVATIHAHKGQDIREPLFYACAEKKIVMLGLKIGGKTLEDIFLELTSGKEPTAIEKIKGNKSLRNENIEQEESK